MESLLLANQVAINEFYKNTRTKVTTGENVTGSNDFVFDNGAPIEVTYQCTVDTIP